MELKLSNVRLSFDTLGEPTQYQGKGAFRWSSTFLVPVGDPQKAMVDKAIAAVATEKWGAKAAKILPGILADKKGCFWLDGALKEYDGYEGMFAATAYRYQDKGRMMVLDNDKSPIYDERGQFYPGKAGRIYAGCYVNAKIEIWAQDNDTGKGIRSTLMVVQRVGKGDAFGGGKPPSADDFDEVADGSDADDLT